MVDRLDWRIETNVLDYGEAQALYEFGETAYDQGLFRLARFFDEEDLVPVDSLRSPSGASPFEERADRAVWVGFMGLRSSLPNNTRESLEKMRTNLGQSDTGVSAIIYVLYPNDDFRTITHTDDDDGRGKPIENGAVTLTGVGGVHVGEADEKVYCDVGDLFVPGIVPHAAFSEPSERPRTAMITYDILRA